VAGSARPRPRASRRRGRGSRAFVHRCERKPEGGPRLAAPGSAPVELAGDPVLASTAVADFDMAPRSRSGPASRTRAAPTWSTRPSSCRRSTGAPLGAP
jgi:hypothetical protein